jgi:hypothetical protein
MIWGLNHFLGRGFGTAFVQRRGTMEKKIIFCSIILLLSVFTGMAWGGTEGTNNTFYGVGAGNSIAADDSCSTFIGYQAGYSNTTGIFNSLLGVSAGYANTTGSSNSFFGYRAGQGNTTADYNSFIGAQAGFYNTTGYNNTFVGANAGLYSTTGVSNSFLGVQAGNHNTTGDNNTFLGYDAGYSNTTGFENSFLGVQAGNHNTTGDNNTFLGDYAGYANTTGYQNTFLGNHAGYNDNGHYNTFIGPYAGYRHTTGDNNTFLGNWAGYSMTTGSGNVLIGYTAGYKETSLSNRLFIDNSDTSYPLIYGEFDSRKMTINGNLEVIGPDNGLVHLSNVTTDNTTKVSRIVLRHYSNAQLPVYLFGAASTGTDNFVAFGGGADIGNAATQLDLFTAPDTTTPVGYPRLTIIGNGNVGIGTQTPAYPLQMASGAYVSVGGMWMDASSREFKDNVKGLKVKDAIETLQGLNPVTFNYKVSPEENHVGFVAEDVPDLVATKDRKGLSPMDIVAVLTKVLQELKVENEGLKAKNESLENRLLAIERMVIAPK